MNTPTYEQQWQKITEAYMRDEIKPYSPSFCFCGTLCDNSNEWFYMCQYRHNDFGCYKGDDFVKMERALLGNITTELGLNESDLWFDEEGNYKYADEHPDYETALFNGMVAALEVLRQIHVKRGDVTAIEIPLVKRSLNTIV